MYASVCMKFSTDECFWTQYRYDFIRFKSLTKLVLHMYEKYNQKKASFHFLWGCVMRHVGIFLHAHSYCLLWRKERTSLLLQQVWKAESKPNPHKFSMLCKRFLSQFYSCNSVTRRNMFHTRIKKNASQEINVSHIYGISRSCKEISGIITTLWRDTRILLGSAFLRKAYLSKRDNKQRKMKAYKIHHSQTTSW